MEVGGGDLLFFRMNFVELFNAFKPFGITNFIKIKRKILKLNKLTTKLHTLEDILKAHN